MLFHDLISGDELLADAAALLTNRRELVDKGLVELELFCVETCGGGHWVEKTHLYRPRSGCRPQG